MTRTDAGDRREFIIDFFMTSGKMRQAGRCNFGMMNPGTPENGDF
jgi:hypothetical protein